MLDKQLAKMVVAGVAAGVIVLMVQRRMMASDQPPAYPAGYTRAIYA